MRKYFIFTAALLASLSAKTETFEVPYLLKDSVLIDLDDNLRQAVVIDLNTAFDNYTQDIMGTVLPKSNNKDILMAMFFKKSNSVTMELLDFIIKGQDENAYREIKLNSGLPEFAEIFRKNNE